MNDPNENEIEESRSTYRRRILQAAGGFGVAGLAGMASGRRLRNSNGRKPSNGKKTVVQAGGEHAYVASPKGPDNTPFIKNFGRPQVGSNPSLLINSSAPGGRHLSIEAGHQAVFALSDRIAEMSNTTVTVDTIDTEGHNINPPVEFPRDADTLAQYDALMFMNSNGNTDPNKSDLNVLDDEQAAAFEEYMRGGGGFVGVHNAADNQPQDSFYNNLLGTHFKTHPSVQDVRINIEDHSHPSTITLPDVWIENIEPYTFYTNPRGDVHVLASLDDESIDDPDNEMEGTDHPITWAQHYEGARSWYTGLGHRPQLYADELYRNHLLGGIMWAAGYMPGGEVDKGYQTSSAGSGGGNGKAKTGNGKAKQK